MDVAPFKIDFLGGLDTLEVDTLSWQCDVRSSTESTKTWYAELGGNFGNLVVPLRLGLTRAIINQSNVGFHMVARMDCDPLGLKLHIAPGNDTFSLSGLEIATENGTFDISEKVTPLLRWLFDNSTLDDECPWNSRGVSTAVPTMFLFLALVTALGNLRSA
jgi:hypothetical protein